MEFKPQIARRLGIMLLRYASEVLNLAAIPQFRHGPSQEVETAWDWGQPDWSSDPNPIASLFRKGMLRYAIDIPTIGASLALAYDTIWPWLKEDRELVARAQALGLAIARPADTVCLIEEMLASLLQCLLDGGGLSNLPRVSEGALTLIRGLDRPDAQDALEWLYDRGPEKLRGFGTNDFFPCGTPPEATGGYNDTHTRGLFALEYQLRQLRQRSVPGRRGQGRVQDVQLLLPRWPVPHDLRGLKLRQLRCVPRWPVQVAGCRSQLL